MDIETLFSDFLQAEVFPWLCQERARKKLNSYRRMYPDFDQKLTEIGLPKGKKTINTLQKRQFLALARGYFCPLQTPSA